MKLEAEFYSQALRHNTRLNLLLPSLTSNECMHGGTPRFDYFAPEHRWPTLILFHCGFSGAGEWLRFSSVERYAHHYGVAVVLPEIENSFGVDMAHGEAWFSYLSQELPRLLAANFPLALDREHLYVAGPSMGGYAATHWALKQPGRFGGVAVLSSMLDFAQHVTRRRAEGTMEGDAVEDVFGGMDKLMGGEYDLYQLAKDDVAAGGPLPRFRVCCGLQDPFVRECQASADKLKALGLEVTAEFSPGGHTWAYWDGELPRILEWMSAGLPENQ